MTQQQSGIVAYACNANTQETEVVGAGIIDYDLTWATRADPVSKKIKRNKQTNNNKTSALFCGRHCLENEREALR